ncbi:MAG: rRNA-binding ribosome biosynthesis protein utp25 [Bathelium mastoideum]|nr:MAG: rRNA-binding ribosome biosynthesis protein utp25 [Bathelium mastoideum]
MAPVKRKGKFVAAHRKGARNGSNVQNRFATQRVLEADDNNLNGDAEDASHSSERDSEDESIIEEDGEAASKLNVYNALLQSLQQNVQNVEPQRKKRKLDQSKIAKAPSPKIEEPNGVDHNPLLEDEINASDDRIDAATAVDWNLDEEEDSSDPFEIHLGLHNEQDLSDRIQAINRRDWRVQKHESATGRIISSIPGPTTNTDAFHPRSQITNPKALKLKRRLIAPAQSILPDFDKLQREVIPYIFNYSDLLFAGRTVQNVASLRSMACLHALNHVFKTRDRVLKNNAKLAKTDEGDELELRDQGFTRPKVLFLLETRQACAKMVEVIMGLCEPEQQENKKRFQDTYIDKEEKFADDRPEDFRELFEGNADNDFRLGLKFTRKTVRYFSPFYTSDMILASPLGLRRIVDNEDPKKKEHDFLSSIEIIVVDQAEAMLQQNWEHVEFVFSNLNLQPREAHGCDFSRVRNWYLDGRATHLRQTIIFSAYNTPDLNNLFNTYMVNIAGKVKMQPEYDGSYLSINVPLKQTFSRIDAASPGTDPDTRFKYFSTAIVTSLTRHLPPADPTTGGAGILIFIPSYLDFVRVRNYFSNSSATQNISFASVSEYSSTAEVQRARARFLDGRHAVLLYTERAHHFRRYRIRGVKKVVFYGLPDNPVFYREIVEGFLSQTMAEGRADAADVGSRVVFSKWDALKLERIVGSKRVSSLLKEKEGDTFDFVS